VKDKGGAEAAFKADIGGFFDLKMKDLKSTKLADVVKASRPTVEQGPQDHSDGMLRLDQTRFDAQVSMKDNVVTWARQTQAAGAQHRRWTRGDGRR